MAADGALIIRGTKYELEKLMKILRHAVFYGEVTGHILGKDGVQEIRAFKEPVKW